MGQMKKLKEVINKYNNLRGREKEAVREARIYSGNNLSWEIG